MYTITAHASAICEAVIAYAVLYGHQAAKFRHKVRKQ